MMLLNVQNFLKNMNVREHLMREASEPEADGVHTDTHESSEATSRAALILSFAIGIVYALVARLIFGADTTSRFLSTLSGAFLIGVPLVLGALVVYLLPADSRTSWLQSFFAPFFPAIVFLVGVTLLGIEAWICIVMASPIFIAASMMGGVIMCGLLRLTRRRAHGQDTAMRALALLVIAPYVAGPLEKQISVQDSYRTVHTQIVIRASPAHIWPQIIRVPSIRPEEQRLAFFQIVGLPRPLEAALPADELGAMREARYENGLRFIERVTVWEPSRRLRFSIDLDSRFPIPAPFGVIDGAPFALIDGEYMLEPLPDGTSRLHLSSTQRVTTRFNAYSGWWSDVLMTDLQTYLLEIIRRRVEGK
jgi:hypothetical protein